jgi:hypothetical protein
MKKSSITIFGVVVLSFFITSYMDPNEKNRYIQSVTVLNVPPGNWDMTSAPDLSIQIIRASSNNWEYITKVANDVKNVPITLNFPNEILATNENWKMRLVDVDDWKLAETTYDVILSWNSFNPVTSGNGGKIKFNNDNGVTILEINYTER